LKRWKIIDTEKCDICEEVQDILHLIFQCDRSQPIWNKVGNVFDTVITSPDLVYGRTDNVFNVVVSLVAFFLYKDWIVCKNENIIRKNRNLMSYLKFEIIHRIQLYSLLNWNNVVNKLEELRREINQ